MASTSDNPGSEAVLPGDDEYRWHTGLKRAHGVLDPAARTAARRDAVDAIVLPAARTLLTAARAA